MYAPERPLRILMTIHTRWERELGAPRVQMELGEELTAMGDRVEKLSYEDVLAPEENRLLRAAPRPVRTVAGYLESNRSFAARARVYVRANARRFDVIDANQTDLPYSKENLGFSGLLVARSVGLIPAYDRFERWAARRWPEPWERSSAVTKRYAPPSPRSTAGRISASPIRSLSFCRGWI